ncbi:MAG: alpha/beta fold hydrolase [Thermoplasmata archaeon]
MPDAPSAPVRLHARVIGEGAPVLLVHGLGGDHTSWGGVAGRLGTRFRVTVPDLRGHGASPLPEGSTLSFAEHEGDLGRLLDEAASPSTHVVGLSAGAFLALRWTIDHPQRVRSLVLIGGASHCDAHTRAVGERWAETLQKDGFDAYVLRLLKDLVAPDWIEAHMEFADRLKEDLRGRDLKGPVLWSRAIRTFDLRGRLGGIRVPTLVMHGMDDQVVDASHGRLLRQAIPGAELKLFPNTGHLVPIEHPIETADAIERWVAAAEGVPSAPPSP